MQQEIKLTLVQSNLYWQDPVSNIRHFNKQLTAINKKSTDIILLPEMFTTGFSMNATQFAEEPEGIGMQWMHETAAALKSVVCGSIMTKEKKHFYNRLIWMQPDGHYISYDKHHLFSMGKEHLSYEAGDEQVIAEYKGWKFCLQICYDLRFPVWSRNHLSGKNEYRYDVLIYVANWPAVRSHAWRSLLPARAIENQCYTAAVNRVGIDNNGVKHQGDSVVLDPLGLEIIKAKPNAKALLTASLSANHLKELRKKFPVLADADRFRLQ